jgi:hypothetical protein
MSTVPLASAEPHVKTTILQSWADWHTVTIQRKET